LSLNAQRAASFDLDINTATLLALLILFSEGLNGQKQVTSRSREMTRTEGLELVIFRDVLRATMHNFPHVQPALRAVPFNKYIGGLRRGRKRRKQ
jgi:hypothetical protein